MKRANGAKYNKMTKKKRQSTVGWITFISPFIIIGINEYTDRALNARFSFFLNKSITVINCRHSLFAHTAPTQHNMFRMAQ